MFAHELGSKVKGPSYAGVVMARAEYWDGTRKYLVREVAESDAPPAQAWLLEQQIQPAIEDPPDSPAQEEQEKHP